MSSGSFETILPMLQCPDCRIGALINLSDGSGLGCVSCSSQFPMSDGRPILLRSNSEVFCANDYIGIKLSDPHSKSGMWKRFVPNSSVNLASKRVLSRLRDWLAIKPSAKVLVVGGGRQREWLDNRLGAGDSVHVVYTDIDSSADVDLFCDGHDLPFVDGVFDAVVTTAVLEHVLYPERVAAEITRVIKTDGLLYSELPFMQQVHEGAYDFTRYTLSGHRRLFNGFSEIESGMVAGPGTALVWAIENFGLAFTVRPVSRKVTKAVVRLFFGWIKYFDLLFVRNPAAMDGASCTYLLGSKAEGHVSDADIIALYVGAQNLKHT